MSSQKQKQKNYFFVQKFICFYQYIMGTIVIESESNCWPAPLKLKQGTNWRKYLAGPELVWSWWCLFTKERAKTRVAEALWKTTH